MLYFKLLTVILISFLSFTSASLHKIPKTVEIFDYLLRNLMPAPYSILSYAYRDLMAAITRYPGRCKMLHDLIFEALQGLNEAENHCDAHWKVVIDTAIMKLIEQKQVESVASILSIINNDVMPKHPFYGVIEFPLTVDMLVSKTFIDFYVEEFEDKVFTYFIRQLEIKDSDVDFSSSHIKLLNFLNKFIKLFRFNRHNSSYHRALLIAATVKDFKFVYNILLGFTQQFEVNYDLDTMAEAVFDKLKEFPSLQKKILKLAGINRHLQYDDYLLISDRCRQYRLLDITYTKPQFDEIWWNRLGHPRGDIKKKLIRTAFDPKTEAEWALFWINFEKYKNHERDHEDSFYEIALAYSLIWEFDQIYPDFEGKIAGKSVKALLAELEEDGHWKGVTVSDLEKSYFISYIPAARFFIKRSGLYSQIHEKFRDQCLIEYAGKGEEAIVEFLLTESGTNYSDPVLKMAATQAVHGGNADIVRMFIFIQFPTLEEKNEFLEPLISFAIEHGNAEILKVLLEEFDADRSFTFTNFNVSDKGLDVARYLLSMDRLRGNLDKIKADFYRLSCEYGNLTNFEYAFFLIHDKEKLQEGLKKLAAVKSEIGQFIKFIFWLKSKRKSIKLDEDLVKILYVAAIKSNKTHYLDQLISTFPWPKNLSVDEAMDLAISSKAKYCKEVIENKFSLKNKKI